MGARNFALFSLSRLIIRSFLFSSLWGSSRGILVVFLKAGKLKCARLEFLGCRVKPPAAPKPPGFHTTTRGPKRAHLSFPAFKNTKIPREDLQREEKRTNYEAGEGKRRAKFWAVQGKGGPWEGWSVGRGGPWKGGPGEGRSRGHRT